MKSNQDIKSTYETCPFGSGLRKFARDPVVVIFFKNEKKYKWWSDPVLRKFWLDPIL